MSTINDFGIPGIGTGYLEPMRKNRWRVTFANFGGGTNTQPLSMQAITVTRPKQTFEEVEMHRYTTRAYVAGKYSWEPLNMTVELDVTGTVSKAITDQIQRQQWLIGAEGQFLAQAAEGSLYKFVAYLEQLDGNQTVVETWTYESCMITNVNWGDLAYEDGKQVTADLTIRFDHARLTTGGYKGAGVALGGIGTVSP